MADKIYELPPGTVTEKTDPRRKDGKTGELAFGFGGALGAWLKFDSSGRHSDERIIEICKAWRAEHPMVLALWRGLENAAKQAVRNPGTIAKYRQIAFEVVDEWLTMILPDGKRLWYYEPKLTMGMPAWHNDRYEECRQGTCDHEPVQKLSYMSQKDGQWKRVFTYGGKLTENAVQATSRQILVPAMRRVEEAGYPIILTVYDEIVAEAPIGFGSLEEFAELMAGPLPDFAKDWPITLGPPWEGTRYRK
jgi:DNA polymerase